MTYSLDLKNKALKYIENGGHGALLVRLLVLLYALESFIAAKVESNILTPFATQELAIPFYSISG